MTEAIPRRHPGTAGRQVKPDASDAWIQTLHRRAYKFSERGEFGEAAEAYRQILALDPDQKDALKNLGIISYYGGNNEQATIFLEKAVLASPEDGVITDALKAAYFACAKEQNSNGSGDQAIATLRKLRRLDPEHTAARINLGDLLIQAGRAATLGDIAPIVAPDRIGKHLLVACMPKSGSTFLTESLVKLTGRQRCFFSFAYRQNEQELYLPDLIAVAGENTVTQQHCRATAANIQIIQAFGMRPVVLVRRLYDVVVSLADFYDTGAVANSFLENHWMLLDGPERFDAIIDHVIPWYLAFFASWIEAAEADRVDSLLLTYEQMIADKPGTLKAICEFQEIETSLADCRAAVMAAEKDENAIRMNKGVAGRGADALSDAQKARIARLAGYYRGLDFSLIGL